MEKDITDKQEFVSFCVICDLSVQSVFKTILGLETVEWFPSSKSLTQKVR
jgi:hypothetical protein